MLTIYLGFVKLQDIGELSFVQKKVIESIKNKITGILPDVNEKVYQADPKNVEYEKYQKMNSTPGQQYELSDQSEYVQEFNR